MLILLPTRILLSPTFLFSVVGIITWITWTQEAFLNLRTLHTHTTTNAIKTHFFSSSPFIFETRKRWLMVEEEKKSTRRGNYTFFLSVSKKKNKNVWKKNPCGDCVCVRAATREEKKIQKEKNWEKCGKHIFLSIAWRVERRVYVYILLKNVHRPQIAGYSWW